MTKVYLIEEHSGSYDEYQCNTIRAFYDRDTAEAALIEYEEKTERSEKDHERWLALSWEWSAANPRPPYNTKAWFDHADRRVEWSKQNPAPEYKDCVYYSINELEIE